MPFPVTPTDYPFPRGEPQRLLRGDQRRRSRTPGGRRRGAGAAVGTTGRGGPKKRRPPPGGPRPFMGPGYKVGGPVPEINDAAVAKYQVGGMAPTVTPRFPSQPRVGRMAELPNVPGQDLARIRTAYGRANQGRYGMAPGMGARGRATPPALGPQKPKRRGRGRGGRDV